MGVWKDKARDHWRYQFMIQGETVTGRGFPTRREAVTAREKRRKEILEASKQTLPVMGFKEAASAYLDYSERKHAKATYQYKKLIIKHFLDMYSDLPITEIEPSHVTNYLNTMKSNAVYNARRKDLSACFSWIINNYDLNIKNPCAKIGKMPHSTKQKAIPSEDEIIKMIVAARPGDEQDIIMCCVHLLGRIDEILRMTWQDVNFEKRAVTLWTRKRKDGALEPDAMPMNDDLYAILKRRYDARGNETWVFYNQDTGDRYHHRPKMMASLCKRAGIEPVGQTKRKIDRGKNKGKYKDVPVYYGFHALRHFMASHLIDAEKTSLKTVSKLLRHKNLKTTEIYIHSIDEAVRLTADKIKGKFTPENNFSRPQLAPKKEKESTGNG